jgi:hypothetical protein
MNEVLLLKLWRDKDYSTLVTNSVLRNAFQADADRHIQFPLLLLRHTALSSIHEKGDSKSLL